DPILIPSADANGQPILLPFYQLMDQVGLDLQLVTGNWLWKLEVLYQENTMENFYAATGGFEYTFIGINGSSMDLGLIAEFVYDDRKDDAATSFENDLLWGFRLAVNDTASTELLLGLSYDLNKKGNVLQLEASRRLRDDVKIFVEGWAFLNTEPDDYYLDSIRDDDFIRLRIFYYF
ncbi:MAG: hypothetical protein JRE18_11370, partial [Deltaproteobacteria bacterium]|nr:hypothetical protein [Deltaproteobacteria bacterium]